MTILHEDKMKHKKMGDDKDKCAERADEMFEES